MLQPARAGRIEYEIRAVDPFLSASDLEQMTFELDIGKLELYRPIGRKGGQFTRSCIREVLLFLIGARRYERRRYI